MGRSADNYLDVTALFNSKRGLAIPDRIYMDHITFDPNCERWTHGDTVVSSFSLSLAYGYL